MDLKVIEQSLCDQAKMIRLNECLAALQMDLVKKDDE